MTCIAAVAAPDGTVYIGGDSAGVDTWDLSMGTHLETKVWRNDHLVFGACGSFRVAQLLRWHMNVPAPGVDEDPLRYLSGRLTDAMRDALNEGGALTMWQEDSTHALTDSGLVVGFAGRVFEVYSDFGVGEMLNGYAAVGCGSLIAMGSLASTEILKPKQRVRLALAAAERHSAGVRGPMTILKQKATP